MDIDIAIPPRSASERWSEHYFRCPICQVGETEFEEDILCDIGRVLRQASQDAVYVPAPEELLKEARKALWESMVALNHAVTYHFSGSYLMAQRRLDEARRWQELADKRIVAAEREITGGQ